MRAWRCEAAYRSRSSGRRIRTRSSARRRRLKGWRLMDGMSLSRTSAGIGPDQVDGDRLSLDADLGAEHVLYPAPRPRSRLPVDDLDGPSRLLAADEVLRPSPCMDGRGDQLGAGVGLRERHGVCQL